MLADAAGGTVLNWAIAMDDLVALIRYTVDLRGDSRMPDVAALDLRLVGEPTALSVFVTDAAPTTNPTQDRDLAPAAEVEAGTQERLALDEPVEGRYVTLWLTALPAVPDGFRAELAEVTVRG